MAACGLISSDVCLNDDTPVMTKEILERLVQSTFNPHQNKEDWDYAFHYYNWHQLRKETLTADSDENYQKVYDFIVDRMSRDLKGRPVMWSKPFIPDKK